MSVRPEPKRNRWRMHCARRWRRLMVEQLEWRQLLTADLPLDQPPAALDDSYVTTDEFAVNRANGVLANDRDPSGGILSVQIVTAPLHGELNLNQDGSFHY